MNFGSHADSVVAVTVALVNTLTPGERQGRPYEPPSGAKAVAAVTAAVRASSRTAAAPKPGELPAFTALAAAARAVFDAAGTGDFDTAARLTNELLRRFRSAPSLERHDREPWHLHFHGDARQDASGWGGGVSVALATVLGSEHADRLGVCEAAACDRVYVDLSRNGTRRFCSTACQNRVKAAAHRARVQR